MLNHDLKNKLRKKIRLRNKIIKVKLWNENKKETKRIVRNEKNTR